MKHVVIIGAGLGGLSAALRLALQGFRVTIIEKNQSIGGKMGRYCAKGYSFDTGPTLLTMPFVVQELFEHAGCSSVPIDLQPVDPICRYHWSDGSVLEATTDVQRMAEAFERFTPGDGEGFFRFLQHGEQLYRSAVETFLFHPIGSLQWHELAAYAHLFPRVFRIDAVRSYDRAVRSFFRDRRTQQFFLRFATYNGSSPYQTPATMAVIPYIELTFGGWYITGGMYRLAETIMGLARQKGVVLHTGVEVRRILIRNRRCYGVQLNSGEIVEADAVLTNADAEYTETILLGRPHRQRRCKPSLSGFILLLGVRKRFQELGHHIILFSNDYPAEFDGLFDRYQLPHNPTVYICNSSSTDETQAPPGCSNLFILVNAPPLVSNHSPAVDWNSEAHRYRSAILKTMHDHGVAIAESDIEVEQMITPSDFEERFNAMHGAIYGQASNTRRTAFFRPPNRSRTVKGLYSVGGSGHPGGGVPLVLLSGKLATDLIRKDLCA